MIHYPTPAEEWSLDRKFAVVKEAGFDGVIHPPHREIKDLVDKHGLQLLGFVSSDNAAEFPGLLEANRVCGARHINVHLGTDCTETAEALDLALALADAGREFGVEPAIETHRNTCTETPEKAYTLADLYQKVTGQLLPFTWDFSHFAVVKHLAPIDFVQRLMVCPDLIQRAQQFHFRPFNGHHCQIPVTDGKGNLTLEMEEWLPFAEAVLKCWLEGNRNTSRELFICPEMGPVFGGYNLSTLPNSWEEAKVLRTEIDRMWKLISS